MTEAVIVSTARTPIGKAYRGLFNNTEAPTMGGIAIRGAVERAGVDPAEVDDVIMGCANQAGEDNRNVARMALLLAGLPYTVPGETVNRLCSSGLSAIIHANRAIKSGDGDLFISGGVENMTRGPYVIAKPSSAFGTDAKMYDSSFGWRFVNHKMHELYGTDGMGVTAENLIVKFSIVVYAAPYSSEAATTAYNFSRTLLEQGHEINRLFYYSDGVHNDSQHTVVAQYETNLQQCWHKLNENYEIETDCL